MKGSFIIAFLWVEFIAILHGSTLRAQKARPQVPVIGLRSTPVISRRPTPVAKKNFTGFTRKYINRGTVWMARNKAFLNHPDANLDDQYGPNNAVELFEKRTIDSKFYINKDNPSIVYSQRSSGPMHFKQNGQWITIDSRLQPKGSLVYEASNQNEPVGFDIKRKASYIITADGKTYFNDWKLYGQNAGGETLLATAIWTQYTAGDDGIAIKNIFPGIDAEMKVSRGGIKTNFIVHANRFSSYKTLLFRDSFVNEQAGSFSFSNGSSGNGLVSSVDFRVSAATVFHVKEGVMYQKQKPSSTHRFIPYFLDQNKLTLAINRDFLNAPGRVGDVVIDPQVQSTGLLLRTQITGSHSNSNCSLDTACEYDFMVPAPAGATLIDAQFSFEFTANDPCVGKDGAFSFASGSCVSQKYVGTATGPGAQTFPNQSILMTNGANLAGCLPAPVCGLLPQNIPFSFFFYRSCHGPDGCDGSCIAASQDLTITLVGRTFDSASVTASTLNSCPGAPVTLTARGFFGVPPYNFTWLGLPQFNGDSVITVNPTANTTYTVQVNDPCILPVNLPILKSVTVNVFAKPPTPVLTSNSPVCAGGQLILSVPSIPGTTYTIKNPAAGLGGGPFTSQAVFNNVTASYAGTWIAVATDANGCTSDTGSTTVVINPLLTPTATITSSATNICAGTLVTFNATATGAGTSPTYQWLLNSQKVGTNSPTYSGNSFANNDAISCIVSANGPCANGFDLSNVIVLHVSAPVTPTFNAIGPLCQNSPPPALPLTSKEGIAGTWSPASISTSALGTVTYTFTPSAGSCANPASLNIMVVGSVAPTFPTIASSYCQNATAPALPLTSKEGITGTWSPVSINTSVPGTVTYTFTPSVGSCATPASLNITIVATVIPTFPTIANSYCQNATAPALPLTSKEGITGTWTPASINTSIPGTATHIFTPTAGSCATPVSLNITVVGSVGPTFPTIASSYCQNATAPALPLTSKEGITGTWSPASINTSLPGTVTYTFTPSAGSCATPASLNITIVGTVTPTFTAIGPLCQNSTPPVLPLTSKEGITGTWNPASINTSVPGTATYIFTPTAGSCSPAVSLNITIVGTLTSTFNAIGPLCQNSAPPALPLVSKEGTAGTWSPASINTSALGTVVYTFTPSTGSCATPGSLNITIAGSVSPTFPTIANSYCQNATAPALPPTSKEGITGTWSPASINTSVPGTVTYAFTPAVGSCATPASLNITVVGNVSPTFPTIANSYCQNATAPALPLVSKEGITGTWSPASINIFVPGTATYTFTPSVGSCSAPVSLNITIIGNVAPTFPTVANVYCQNSTAPVLPLLSNEGISGTWTPASINTTGLGTTVYTFTPAAGSCSAPVSLNITIVSSLTLVFDPIGPLCQNSTPPALPLTSKEGIAGTWNPAIINTSAFGTVVYTFTPVAGSCANPTTLNITIIGTVSPTFPTIANSYCQNTTVPALPSTSKEGITGTWSPASISTSVLGTATYTFTPSAGSCSTPVSLDITIVSTLTPTFDAIGPLCHNSTPPTLPPTSREGVTGTWSPGSINTSALGTATYQFTPSSTGNCAIPTSMTITIATSITPTFPTIADSYCLNDIAPALPTTSKEGIDGTWNPSAIKTANAGSTVFTFTPTGGQCGVPAQITIVINPPPVLTMGPDLTIADGASTTLNVSVTGNIVNYQWKPSTGLNNAAIKDPVASPSSTTTYTLVVTDDNNCEASGRITITVSGRSKISVPNAFSPNGDGINDTWIIGNLSIYPGATVDVFNRYGQRVFHSENFNKAWDGTYNGRALPVGTYYYIIDLKNNEKKTAGSVTIFK